MMPKLTASPVAISSSSEHAARGRHASTVTAPGTMITAILVANTRHIQPTEDSGAQIRARAPATPMSAKRTTVRRAETSAEASGVSGRGGADGVLISAERSIRSADIVDYF